MGLVVLAVVPGDALTISLLNGFGEGHTTDYIEEVG
jgi:hypothetical protein